MKMIRSLWRENDAQDMVEYSLMLAFVALASAALMVQAGAGVKNVWQQVSGCPSGTHLETFGDIDHPVCEPNGH